MSGCAYEHTHATRTDRCPACGHNPEATSMLTRHLKSTGVPPREYIDLGECTLQQAEMREGRSLRPNILNVTCPSCGHIGHGERCGMKYTEAMNDSYDCICDRNLNTTENIIRRLINKQDIRGQILRDPSMFNELYISDIKDALEGKVPFTLHHWEQWVNRKQQGT